MNRHLLLAGLLCLATAPAHASTGRIAAPSTHYRATRVAFRTPSGTGSGSGSSSTDITTTGITYQTTDGVANVAQFSGSAPVGTEASVDTFNFDGSISFGGCVTIHPTNPATGSPQALSGNFQTTGSVIVGWQAIITTDGALGFYAANNANTGNMIFVASPGGSLTAAKHRVCWVYDPSKANAAAGRVTLYIDGAQQTLRLVNDALSGSITSTAPYALGQTGSSVWLYKGAMWNADVWTGIPTTQQMQ